ERASGQILGNRAPFRVTERRSLSGHHAADERLENAFWRPLGERAPAGRACIAGCSLVTARAVSCEKRRTVPGLRTRLHECDAYQGRDHEDTPRSCHRNLLRHNEGRLAVNSDEDDMPQRTAAVEFGSAVAALTVTVTS